MTLVATMIAGLVVVLTAGTADVATIMAARQRAIQAAEAAAVAAADAATWLSDANPATEADRLADANDATLVSCACDEGSETVTVEVSVQPDVRFLLAWMDLDVHAIRTAIVEPWVASWAP